MENIKLACSEVYCLLEILGDSYKNKLPNKFLDFINQNRNEDFSLEIDENQYENLKISRDGLVLISFLNLNYWVDDDEKKKLIEIYKKNDEKKQEKINRYKQPDWLSQSNKKETTESVENNDIIETKNETVSENVEDNNRKNEKALIEVKNISFFDKIKNFIKNIFYKGKE